MKSIFFLLVSICFYSPVWATKARLAALNYSPHLYDEQLLFLNPIHINYLSEFISLETGTANAASSGTGTANAEGILSRRLFEKNVVLALGHQDFTVLRTRRFVNSLGATYNLNQNPIHIFVGNETGDINYSVGFSYSNFHDKVALSKENSLGFSAAVEIGAWQIYSTALVNNSVEQAANKLEAAGALSLGISFVGDNTQAFVVYNRDPVKSTIANVEDQLHLSQTLRIGIVESNVKDGNDIFWGAEIDTTKVDCHTLASVHCEQSYISTTVPVWVGIESEASSWLTLRASLTQTMLVNQSKDDVGYPSGVLQFSNGSRSEYLNGPNSTTFMAGLGLKFKDVTLDGSLAAATGQQLNQNSFLSHLGLKFNY